MSCYRCYWFESSAKSVQNKWPEWKRFRCYWMWSSIFMYTNKNTVWNNGPFPMPLPFISAKWNKKCYASMVYSGSTNGKLTRFNQSNGLQQLNNHSKCAILHFVRWYTYTNRIVDSLTTVVGHTKHTCTPIHLKHDLYGLVSKKKLQLFGKNKSIYMHWPFAKRLRSFCIPLCVLKLFCNEINNKTTAKTKQKSRELWNGSAFQNVFGGAIVMKYVRNMRNMYRNVPNREFIRNHQQRGKEQHTLITRITNQTRTTKENHKCNISFSQILIDPFQCIHKAEFSINHLSIVLHLQCERVSITIWNWKYCERKYVQNRCILFDCTYQCMQIIHARISYDKEWREKHSLKAHCHVQSVHLDILIFITSLCIHEKKKHSFVNRSHHCENMMKWNVVQVCAAWIGIGV